VHNDSLHGYYCYTAWRLLKRNADLLQQYLLYSAKFLVKLQSTANTARVKCLAGNSCHSYRNKSLSSFSVLKYRNISPAIARIKLANPTVAYLNTT